VPAGAAENKADAAVSRSSVTRRSVLGCSPIFVEQRPLNGEGIHDRQRHVGAEHVGVYLCVDDIHGSTRFSRVRQGG
jgi:hypothetical protein